MIEASPSLVRYVERAGLPVGDACECFIAGVASYLAANSWLAHAEDTGVRIPPRTEVLTIAEVPSKLALHTAYFFAGGMVAKDPHYSGTSSLAVVLAGAWRRMWPEENTDAWLRGTWALELGWCVAAESDGSGAAWEDDHPEHGLHAPGIACADEDFFATEADGCLDSSA